MNKLKEQLRDDACVECKCYVEKHEEYYIMHSKDQCLISDERLGDIADIGPYCADCAMRAYKRNKNNNEWVREQENQSLY